MSLSFPLRSSHTFFRASDIHHPHITVLSSYSLTLLCFLFICYVEPCLSPLVLVDDFVAGIAAFSLVWDLYHED